MRFHGRGGVAVCLMWVIVVIAPSAGAVTFSDGTFNLGDWTATKIVDISGLATFTVGQSSIGGNPGFYRASTLNLPVAGQIVVANLSNNSTVVPRSVGSVQSVHFEYDFLGTQASENNFAPLIWQGGSYYQGSYISVAPPNSGWTSAGGPPLSAADFSRIAGGGPSTPNFSGSPLQFGYITVFASVTVPAFRVTDLDNWSVNVVVPEPVGLPVTALLMLGPLTRLARHRHFYEVT